jgi:RNA polymerase sigma-70 factor (ECF subfamily)
MVAVSGSGELAVDARRALKARVRTDAALVRAAQRGSPDAFDELFARHWPRAFRAACMVCGDAHAAEDVTQEAFLAAIRALDRFDRRRPFGPWLHRIVVNRAIDHTRARALRREVGGVHAPDAAAPQSAAPDEDLVEAVAALGPEQRAVVVLRHLLGYSPGEIAHLLDVPRGTVNSRLRRGLDTLAEELDSVREPR